MNGHGKTVCQDNDDFGRKGLIACPLSVVSFSVLGRAGFRYGRALTSAELWALARDRQQPASAPVLASRKVTSDPIVTTSEGIAARGQIVARSISSSSSS